MKAIKFFSFILTISLLAFFTWTFITQQVDVKNTPQISSNLSSAAPDPNFNRSHPWSIKLDYTAQMTSTPAYTLHLPLVMKNWPWLYETECETSAAYTVGQRLSRANACQTMVHGQFGATPGWTKQPGYVRYDNISSFEFDHLYLQVRFSKNTAANVPIDVYIDNEVIPRASFYPKNQYSWNRFDCEINVVGSTSGWVYSVDLGHISSGAHFIKFYTAGQDYAVADLDKFILSNLPLTEADCHRCPFIAPTEQK